MGEGEGEIEGSFETDGMCQICSWMNAGVSFDCNDGRRVESIEQIQSNVQRRGHLEDQDFEIVTGRESVGMISSRIAMTRLNFRRSKAMN